MDETGCNLNMTRRYGRAPRGFAWWIATWRRNTPLNRSLVGAMSAAGLLTSMELAGSIDGDAFFVFLQEALGPCLRPGDVVLMDNLSTHKSARMSEVIQAHGAEGDLPAALQS